MSDSRKSVWGGILPFIGYRMLDREECHSLGLNMNQKWQTFEMEWLGICFILFAREVIQKDPVDSR